MVCFPESCLSRVTRRGCTGSFECMEKDPLRLNYFAITDHLTVEAPASPSTHTHAHTHTGASVKVEMMGTLLQPLSRGGGWRQKEASFLKVSNVTQKSELQHLRRFIHIWTSLPFNRFFFFLLPTDGRLAPRLWRPRKPLGCFAKMPNTGGGVSWLVGINHNWSNFFR